MDSRLLIEDASTDCIAKTKEKEYSNYTDVFEDLWPLYLSYGMPYDQYWKGDCKAVIAYRKAQEIEIEQKNYFMWLQGMYVYQAFQTVAFNIFSKNEKKYYLESPMPITKKAIKEKEILDKELEEKRAREWMESLIRMGRNNG